MKIDVNYQFKELDGTIIPEKPDEPEMVDGKPVMKDGKPVIKKSPPFTLRTACANVLLGSRVEKTQCRKCGNSLDKPEEISGQEKLRRFQLAQTIHNSTGLVDIGTKDIELLKERIAYVYPTMTSGQAWEILDPHSVGENK